VAESDGLSPAVQRRRLRAELRRIRLEANQTQEQVASAMDWSLSKIIRIEKGSVGISTNDLKVLLGYYGIIDEDRVQELIAFARAARERSWWSAYSNKAPPRLLQLVEYQAVAMITRNFEPQLVPGLLQTEDYARVVIKEFGGRLETAQLDARVALRMKRQELLTRTEPPPWFFFILSEGVLRSLVGGEDVMTRQISHLIELSSRDNVTIEVVPFSAGVHRGMHAPFVILEFPEAEDEDVLYLENPRGDLISRDASDEIVAYREIFEELRQASLRKDSVKFLHRALDELKLRAGAPAEVLDASAILAT
jgi:transcriptional regulator with XRE-family HTH domain